MKKILLFLFLIPVICQAQYDSTRNQQPVNGYGFQWNTGKVKSQFAIPSNMPQLAVKDSGSIASRNGILYLWSGYLWNPVGANPCQFIPGYVTHNSGYTFDVTAASYCIQNNPYTSAYSQVTLAAADATYDRVDDIVADNTGHVTSITGTPGVNPATPQIDPFTQYLLTTVYVKAGSASPDNVSTAVLWDENTGSPEWTATSSGLTGSFTSPVAYHGSVGTLINYGGGANYLLYSGSSYEISNYNTLKFFLKLKAPWNTSIGNDLMVQIQTNNELSQSIILGSAYGFNPADTSYQAIVIPLSTFETTFYPGQVPLISGVRFTDTGGNAGYYLDWITLQGGISQPTGGNYLTDVFRKAATDSVFKVINGVASFAYIDSIGGGGGSFSGVDSGAYRSSTQVNDTAFTLNRANGIKDTFRFSVGGGSGGGGTTYAAAFPVVIAGTTISLDTSNIANKSQIFFRSTVNPNNDPTGNMIATKTQRDTLAIGVSAAAGQIASEPLTVGGNSKFYGRVLVYYLDTDFGMRLSDKLEFQTNTINIRGNNDGKIKIGVGISASGISIGDNSSSGTQGVSLGVNSNSSGYNNTAIGQSARADYVSAGLGQSLALGRFSWARYRGSIALNGAITEATGQFVLGNTNTGEEDYITEMFAGSGVKRGYNNYGGGSVAYSTGPGIDFRLNGSGGSGTDTSGGVLRLAGGKGTGTGTPGNVIIQTPTKTTTGTTLQTLTDRLTVTPTGVYIANSATVPPTPASGGVFWIESGTLKYKSAGGNITVIANN